MANRQRQRDRQEDKDIRLAVLPFLAAERDVQANFLKANALEKEQALMADVPNWEMGVSAYKTTYMDNMKHGIGQKLQPIKIPY